jgi:hypothetical protein
MTMPAVYLSLGPANGPQLGRSARRNATEREGIYIWFLLGLDALLLALSRLATHRLDLSVILSQCLRREIHYYILYILSNRIYTLLFRPNHTHTHNRLPVPVETPTLCLPSTTFFRNRRRSIFLLVQPRSRPLQVQTAPLLSIFTIQPHLAPSMHTLRD